MSDNEGELERVTIRLSGLTIDITARQSSSRASLDSFELVEAPGARTETGPIAGSSAAPAASAGEAPLEDRLEACAAASDFNEIDLGVFKFQARGLGSAGEWTSNGRVARALQAGFCAGEVLRGDRAVVPKTASLPLRNRWYVCLTCTRFPRGFVTESYPTYRAACFNPRGTAPEPESVSHGGERPLLSFGFGGVASWRLSHRNNVSATCCFALWRATPTPSSTGRQPLLARHRGGGLWGMCRPIWPTFHSGSCPSFGERSRAGRLGRSFCR